MRPPRAQLPPRVDPSPRARRALTALALLLPAVLGCTPATDGGRTSTETARVERVVDGDTLKLAGGERVRLIGVDTPESVKPGAPVECFGKAASAFTERLVEGERVTLTYDAERRDRYDRLLAYVSRASDGRDVGAELLRGGYARMLTIAPNDARADAYAALQRSARKAGRGLWSACTVDSEG